MRSMKTVMQKWLETPLKALIPRQNRNTAERKRVRKVKLNFFVYSSIIILQRDKEYMGNN